jgi:hypothetical protein
MSSTWLTRLTNSHGHRPRLYFTIQGIPDVFQEDRVDVPDVLEDDARPRRKLVTKITQSPTNLDMARRLVVGGTLTLELMDDDAETLLSLFTPRRYRSTFVRADCDLGDTAIAVKSTVAFAADGHAYIGAETVKINTLDPNDFTSVDRAQFGSIEQRHFGTTVDGADVFTSPPSWKGRRVYLTSYFKNDDGTTTADLAREEGVFVIEKAPKHVGDGKWEIQCSELSDEFYKRKIGSGLREVQLEVPTQITSDAPNVLDLEVGNAAASQFVVGDQATQVLLRDDADQALCFYLTDDGSSSIEMSMDPQQATNYDGVGGGAGILWGPFHPIKSARHVAILTDSGASIALMVLTSRTGDQTNGAFDRLPGLERAELNGDSWRMGAGILETEIDTGAFIALGDGGGALWSYVIDGEATVADFLFEFCLHYNCVAYVTRAGKLSVRAIASSTNDATVTVGESMMLGTARVSTEYDEDVIKPRVSINCNYDPITSEFAGTINLLDGKLSDRYPGEGDSLLLSSKTIVVEGYPLGKLRTAAGFQAITRPPMTLTALQSLLRPIMVTQGRGRAFVSSRYLLDVMQVELGDLINLSAPTPNFEGGYVDQLARVVGLGPFWDEACAEATFELLDKPYVIAPAGVCVSAAAEVITLETGTIEADDPATPGRMFADDSAVILFDVSTGTIEDHVVASHTDTTVSLVSAPGFVVAAGDLLLPGRQGDADSSLVNDDGFDALDFIYQIPNDENDPDVVEVTRWR